MVHYNIISLSETSLSLDIKVGGAYDKEEWVQHRFYHRRSFVFHDGGRTWQWSGRSYCRAGRDGIPVPTGSLQKLGAGLHVGAGSDRL